VNRTFSHTHLHTHTHKRIHIHTGLLKLLGLCKFYACVVNAGVSRGCLGLLGG